MTRDEAKVALDTANLALACAARLVRSQREFLERFADECRRFESVGAILAPTFWRSDERQAVAAALGPIYVAALAFERVYAERAAALKDAAAKAGLAIGRERA